MCVLPETLLLKKRAFENFKKKIFILGFSVPSPVEFLRGEQIKTNTIFTNNYFGTFFLFVPFQVIEFVL